MATITVLIDIRAAQIFILNIYKNLLMDLTSIKQILINSTNISIVSYAHIHALLLLGCLNQVRLKIINKIKAKINCGNSQKINNFRIN